MWPSKTDMAAQESGRRSEGGQIEVGPPAEGQVLERWLALRWCVGQAGETETGTGRATRDPTEREQAEREREAEQHHGQTSAGCDRDRRRLDESHVGWGLGAGGAGGLGTAVITSTFAVQIASYSIVVYSYCTGVKSQVGTRKITSSRGETSARGAPPREHLPNTQNMSESRDSTFFVWYRVQRTMRIPAPRASS